MDLNPVALLPSACIAFRPNTDLMEQLKIYGEEEDTLSDSTSTVGFLPARFGVAVDVGVFAREYVNTVSLCT